MAAWAQEEHHGIMNYDFKDLFIISIYGWAHTKYSEITSAFQMRGGWEGWLQFELAL
jgi:hypothetical protein